MGSTVRPVGVLDKSVALLNCVSEAKMTLSELVEATGFSRATTHRLAVGLEAQHLLRRTPDGRFALGLHLLTLGRAAADQFPLADRAVGAMEHLRDVTGESVQLYVTEGADRVCVAALESPHGLRTIVPVGAALSMELGSAGHVLSSGRASSDGRSSADGRTRSTDGSRPANGWIESLEEREAGVASVSAPVFGYDGSVIAAVSVSGPIDRMGPSPGARHGIAVRAAAETISAASNPEP